jgi:hypothetical protein
MEGAGSHFYIQMLIDMNIDVYSQAYVEDYLEQGSGLYEDRINDMRLYIEIVKVRNFRSISN